MKVESIRNFFIAVYFLSAASSLFVLFNNTETALIIFSLGCVVAPFFFCHFLAGYISGILGVRNKYRGNLLTNFAFLRYLMTIKNSRAAESKLISIFFVIFAISILGLIISASSAWIYG